jgi:hypothetical protein
MKIMNNLELYEKYKVYSPYELTNALFSLCEEGDLESVKYVLTSKELEYHANIGGFDNAALSNACENGHLDIVKYLLTSTDLKENANINAHSGRSSILSAACRGGYLFINIS